MPPAVAVCAKNLAWDRLSGAYAKGFASDCSSCVIALWQLLPKAPRERQFIGLRFAAPHSSNLPKMMIPLVLMRKAANNLPADVLQVSQLHLGMPGVPRDMVCREFCSLCVLTGSAVEAWSSSSS
jgi:hypothetical protein